MKTKEHKLKSVCVDLYQFANGTLMRRIFVFKNGKSSITEKFYTDGLNKLVLSISQSNLDADITSVTVYDSSDKDYIDIYKID